MAVVAIVQQAARIATKIYGMQRRYRNIDPTNKFIQKFVPPPYRSRAFKIKEFADILIVGGVIYNALSENGNGKRFRTPSGKVGKGRSYFQRSGGRRQYSKSYGYSNRYKQPDYCRPNRNRRYR